MNIPVDHAIKHFFPAPAFELIYSEAVANAFDAGASQITIDIDLDAYNSPNTLKLSIRDNGSGFNDDNFYRFQNLMTAKDTQHKGLGRLVYLQYFTSVDIESVYAGGYRRRFKFDDAVKETGDDTVSSNTSTYAELRFSSFKGKAIKSYDYVVPMAIKRQLRDLFMPKLYALKAKKRDFCITISLKTKEENPEKGFVNGSVKLTAADIADFKSIEFNAKELDMIECQCKMLYRIEQGVSADDHRLVTALCVDGRTIPFKLATSEQLLPGTSATFLLESSYFDAKTNESRQELILKQDEQEKVRQIFIDRLAEILNDEIPELHTRNEQIKASLVDTYPHLAGYFDQNTIGIINRNRAIADAQLAFCRDEKEILDAQELTDEQYKKSFEQASRVLAQYILYRNKIIHKMGTLTHKSRESDIHSLIVPMQRTFESCSFSHDLYNNNAWLLDDKYMTYRSILSDKQIKELIEKIKSTEETKDANLRPDIAFIFSDDIESTTHPVDVVVVELKRKGLDHLGKHAVIEQIRQRARRLVSLYPTKIQRMWFFGVIDFDREMRNTLKEEEWISLYSKGEAYYKELLVLRVDSDNNELPGGKVPVAVTLLSHDALWKDALARNETFLTILRSSIKNRLSKEFSVSAR